MCLVSLEAFETSGCNVGYSKASNTNTDTVDKLMVPYLVKKCPAFVGPDGSVTSSPWPTLNLIQVNHSI